MLARSRVAALCLLAAACDGGPISDFPRVSNSGGQPTGDNAGSPEPEHDEDVTPPETPPRSGDDDGEGDYSNEWPGDGDGAHDAGVSPGSEFGGDDRPCGAETDAGLPDAGSGNVVTRGQLVRAARPDGACVSSSEIDLVCDGQLRASVRACNQESLAESGGFGLVENCVLTDPAVSAAGDDCVDCYLDFNRCVLLNCLSQCLVPESNALCDACLATNCEAALSACSGLPSF